MLLAPLLLAVPLALQEEATPPEAFTLRFAWPSPGSVHVSEKTRKDGGASTIAYRLDWAPEAEGDAQLFTYREIELLELNGIDVKATENPILQQAVRQIQPSLQAMPGMRIGAAGELVEFVGLEEMVDKVVQMLRERQGDAFDEEIARRMRTPESQSLLVNGVAKRWYAWVGQLASVETFAGDEWLGEFAVPGIHPEETVAADFSFHCVERFEHEGADCVRIETQTVFDEDELRAATIAVLQSQGSAVDVEEFEAAVFSRVDRLEGIWELETLRPHCVKTSEEIRTGSEERSEQHEYTFAWQ